MLKRGKFGQNAYRCYSTGQVSTDIDAYQVYKVRAYNSKIIFMKILKKYLITFLNHKFLSQKRGKPLSKCMSKLSNLLVGSIAIVAAKMLNKFIH